MCLKRLLFAASFLIVACSCIPSCCSLLFFAQDEPGEYALESGNKESDDVAVEKAGGEGYPDEVAPVEDLDVAENVEVTEEAVPTDPGYVETPAECPPGEAYNKTLDLCYLQVDCTTTEDCARFADDLAFHLEDLVDTFDNFGQEASGEEIPWYAAGAVITYQVRGDEIINPALPDVFDELLPHQQNTRRHQEIWDYFIYLFPPAARIDISHFAIFTDGPQETYAAVRQNPDNLVLWFLEVDIVDASDIEELTISYIHEYGHLFTLDAAQVPPNLELFHNPYDEQLYEQAETACPTYFPGEGCSQPDSYINRFFQRFWTDIYDEWLEIQYVWDDDEYYELLDQFYFRYQDQFVSDYAATDPDEDIAETWTYFILTPRPQGNTIADQKVLFFYEYPELVRLRAELVTRIYAYLEDH